MSSIEFRFPNSRILLFAKEPVLGQVKTRLQDALGAEGCLQFYRRLLRHRLLTLESARLAPWELWVAGDPAHVDFTGTCAPEQISVQHGDDLGQRMSHASSTVLARPGVQSVIVIGVDCPVLDAEYLAVALSALQAEQRVVLGPAEDGGYVLIGMNVAEAGVFRDIDWGSEAVLAQTRTRLRELAVAHRLLPMLWDVDRPEDLVRLGESMPELLAPLPRTDGCQV